MQQGQVGGNVGPFTDPAMGGQVNGKLFGTFTYTSAGDASAALPQVQQRLLQTINNLLGQKLASQQVAVQTMPGSLPYYTQEILSQCQTQDLGVTVSDLQLQLQLDAPPPGAAPPMGAMPPTPQQSMQNAFAQEAEERLDPSNYNVKAKIKVGGFNINASTDEGLDADGLGKQAMDKVKSNVIWYVGGCLVVGVVLAGVAGIILWAVMTSGSGATASTGGGKAAAWDGKSTFVCKGNDKVSLSGVTATIASGSAIKASANCRLTMTNMIISAPVGIEASGNARVTVSGGAVTGSEAAAKASGLAKITFSGTTVSGKKDAKKPATITGP